LQNVSGTFTAIVNIVSIASKSVSFTHRTLNFSTPAPAAFPVEMLFNNEQASVAGTTKQRSGPEVLSHRLWYSH